MGLYWMGKIGVSNIQISLVSDEPLKDTTDTRTGTWDMN